MSRPRAGRSWNGWKASRCQAWKCLRFEAFNHGAVVCNRLFALCSDGQRGRRTCGCAGSPHELAATMPDGPCSTTTDILIAIREDISSFRTSFEKRLDRLEQRIQKCRREPES